MPTRSIVGYTLQQLRAMSKILTQTLFHIAKHSIQTAKLTTKHPSQVQVSRIFSISKHYVSITDSATSSMKIKVVNTKKKPKIEGARN